MLKASWCKYNLRFKQPAQTSRETMTCRPTYFVKVWDDSDPANFGIGECGLFRGLSCDDRFDYEYVLNNACLNIGQLNEAVLPTMLESFPSILFGFESAIADLNHHGQGIMWDSPWISDHMPLQLNGLVWMGNFDEMLQRVGEKLKEGFSCIKFKIGGIDFEKEIELIREVRKSFSKERIEIRLDANGGFSSDEVIDKLDRLAAFEIHSIEQPIRQGQWKRMAEICRESPIPIALDEELIGVTPIGQRKLIETIMPQYIILKPTLCGGFSGSNHWIETAEEHGVGWWATSALESNIGLNAISQWVSCKKPQMVQGLGTGALFINNIPSPILQKGEWLHYDTNRPWDYSALQWND